jgi:glycogen(starch) synthase
MVEFSEIVPIDNSAWVDIRHRLGLTETDALRVAFAPGPGDVAGTFRYWQSKQHEPRVPIIAYSLMFYELMDQLRADCLVISLLPVKSSLDQRHNRVCFEPIVIRPASDRWSYLWNQYRFANQLCSIIERFDPHVIVTSTHNPTRSWLRLSKGRKLILSAHNTFWPQGTPPTNLKGRWKKALLAYRAKSLDAAICTSNECARQIAELTQNRILGEVACPQIVERYKIEQRSEVRNLLFLGRIEEPKGVFLLLDVFEQLAPHYPFLTLTLAGSGEAESALKERALRSAFSSRIKLLGRIDSKGVHAAIAASDLVVCPTMTNFNEGLAVVGFEAAAHGIPTLLSSVVPAAKLLGESCTVYQADDAVSFNKALRELIDRPESYRRRCSATASVRGLIYDRTLSWGSGLYRAIMAS